jgi:hypothetical protein
MRGIVVGIALIGGCKGALPPPAPPHIAGRVEAHGGTLGDWRIATTRAKPIGARERSDRESVIDGAIGLDLVDPAAPEHVVRIVSVAPPSHANGKGIVEYVAHRDVEVRIANLGGDAKDEVLLTRASCSRLDAILRYSGGEAFGSARFECDLGARGVVSGDLELFAGGYRGSHEASGHVEASDGTLAGARFTPDRCDADPSGVVFWDVTRPRVIFDVEEVPAPPDTSILHAGAPPNGRLRVTSTAEVASSFEVTPETCSVFRLDKGGSGFVRIGKNQHTTWSGTLELDCATPNGGRLTASLVFRE